MLCLPTSDLSQLGLNDASCTNTFLVFLSQDDEKKDERRKLKTRVRGRQLVFQLIHSPFFSFRTRILSLLWKSPPALFFMVQMGL